LVQRGDFAGVETPIAVAAFAGQEKINASGAGSLVNNQDMMSPAKCFLRVAGVGGNKKLISSNGEVNPSIQICCLTRTRK
jgi:hypothetical protein